MIITSLSNPVWRDTSLNLRVVRDGERFEARWPVPGLNNESGAPDFTTAQDAIDYAEHVGKAIRFQRELAHEQALREHARRAEKVTTIDLVLKDAVGCSWSLVGPDLYVPTQWLVSDNPIPDSWHWTRAKLDKFDGPVTVEHSIQVRGELLATAPYPPEPRHG